MSLTSDAFDEAHRECLRTCFNVLVDNLVVGQPDADARFRTCCELCARARAVADVVAATLPAAAKP